MGNIKISELPILDVISLTGNTIVVQNGITYQTSIDNLLSSNLLNQINYTINVPFNKLYSYIQPIKLSGNTSFSIDYEGVIPGSTTMYQIIGDGVSIISFDTIKKVKGFNFDIRDNYLNNVIFFYDGVSYWVNVYQEDNATTIPLSPTPTPSITPSISITPTVTPTITTTPTITPTSTVTPTVSSSIGASTSPTPSPSVTKTPTTTPTLTPTVSPSSVPSSTIVSWENLVNSTNSGGFLNYTSATSGGRGTVSINTSQPFEVYSQLTSLSQATVLFLDKDISNSYVWGGSQIFESGVYSVSGNLYWADNGLVANNLGGVSLPIWVKLKKSGNDIVLSTSSTENGTYTTVKTFTNALVGISTLYIHVLFAANSVGDKIQVKYII